MKEWRANPYTIYLPGRSSERSSGFQEKSSWTSRSGRPKKGGYDQEERIVMANNDTKRKIVYVNHEASKAKDPESNKNPPRAPERQESILKVEKPLEAFAPKDTSTREAIVRQVKVYKI